MQCNTIQCNTIQYNTIVYSGLQFVQRKMNSEVKMNSDFPLSLNPNYPWIMNSWG